METTINFDEFLNYIKHQDYYKDQISYIQHIPAKEAQFGNLRNPLKKRLQRWLDSNKIKLWGHQADAINNIREGKNTVIVTSTASGKSLCYNLPVLQSILEEPETTALYIFPTKALARDQFTILLKMLSETNIKTSRAGVYDGSVEPQEKRQVLTNGNIIISNHRPESI